MHSSSSACQWGAALAGGTLPNSKRGLYGILAFRFFLNVASSSCHGRESPMIWKAELEDKFKCHSSP